MEREMTGIRNLNLDMPSQVEYNRAKNVEQDSQLSNLTAQLNQLLAQAPAGFLPRVYYGLTRGDQKYRFTAEAEISQALTGVDGTAFELYSDNETDNNYIPAIAVKQDDSTIKIIIQGDYNYDSSSFTAVNMTTGNAEAIILTSVLSLQDASSLSDYPAADNKEKQITVIYNLETNSKNVIFASLDLNSDGVYNWIEIGNFVDGIDGKSVLSITAATYSAITALVKVNDTLLAGETFTAGGNSFSVGGLYKVDALSPLTLSPNGNIRGAQGEQGPAGQDGQDGSTPVITIVDGNWYVNGVDTGVQAIGTDGTNGQNGQSFQMQSGLYSVPANWGQSGNVDGDGNPLLQLPTLPTTGITGKGYVVYDPLTTPLAPYYDLYWANDGDNAWTIIHPFSGIAGTNGTDGETPYISGGTWWIGSTNTGVAATGPQGPQGPAGPGVPSGGTAGQVLTKNSSTDYDTSWGNVPAPSNMMTTDTVQEIRTGQKTFYMKSTASWDYCLRFGVYNGTQAKGRIACDTNGVKLVPNDGRDPNSYFSTNANGNPIVASGGQISTFPNKTGIVAHTSDIDAKVPNAPATDGTYTLKCVVSNSGATKIYQWVLDN